MPSGGRREGAGRPNGACDRLPRRGSKLENEIERLKFVTSQIKPFAGDSLALMQAVYRGEYIATREQLYAANAAMSREHAPAKTVDGRSIEEIREEVRQEFIGGDRDDTLDRLMDEIRRRREVIIEHRDRQMAAWVQAGEFSERAAALVRGLWADEGDRPSHWHIDDLAMPDGGRVGGDARISEIVPPPQPLVVGRKRRAPVFHEAVDGAGAEELGKGRRIRRPPQSKNGPGDAPGIGGRNEGPPTMAASVPSIWEEPAQLGRVPQTAIVVFATPFACYQTRSGRRFVADEDGSISTMDAGDLDDLLRAGC